LEAGLKVSFICTALAHAPLALGASETTIGYYKSAAPLECQPKNQATASLVFVILCLTLALAFCGNRHAT